MLHDNMNRINLIPAIIPQIATNSDTAIVSAILDTQGLDSVTLALLTGAVTDANVTTVLLIEDGDASNLSDAAAVADAQLIGTELLAAFDYTGDSVCRKIGYIGTKRYVRATLTPTGNNSGALPVAATWIVQPRLLPAANPPA